MSTADFDNLAANGVLNFDADAYIRGTAPRYVGNPNSGNAIPFEQPLMPGPYYPQLGAQLPLQPRRDEFAPHEKHKKAGLKEVLALSIVGSLAIYAGVKFKNGIKKLFSSKKTKTPATAAVSAATTASTKNKKGIFKWFKNSKPAKYALGIGIGLVGLYGLYDAVIKRKVQAGFSKGVPSPTQHPSLAQHSALAQNSEPAQPLEGAQAEK